MGSLNWASGLLYLRPLQHHFHSLGLTDRFTPPCRSVPLVLANLLRHWQNPRFLTSGFPICTVQADFKLHISCFIWSSRRWFGGLCPTALGSNAPGPPGYDRYGQFDSSFIYQQARRDPFPHLATFDSQTSPLVRHVRGSEHYRPNTTYSRLPERDSRPPISSKSANIDTVVPSPRNRETYLQGLWDARSHHVCNSDELPPSSVHVSNSGATSPSSGCSVSRLAGEVNVHVSPIPSAQQVIQELRSTQTAEVILIAPWWPS